MHEVIMRYAGTGEDLHDLTRVGDLVRCRECANWIPGYITGQDDFVPPKCGKYQQMVGHFSDDFCSYGQRKEET